MPVADNDNSTDNEKAYLHLSANCKLW